MPSAQASAKNGKKGGRPKGQVGNHTLLAQEMRRRLIEKVYENFDPILDGQMELAKGLFHAEHPVLDESTGLMVRAKKIVKEKPDAGTAKYLLDQIIGKAKETIEHTGNLTTIVQLVTELES